MESIARNQFNRYIKNFEFDHLFNQLGWDYVHQTFPKKAADSTFQFQYIADKAGFAILICEPDAEGKIPDAQTRKRIHTEIAKLHHEHLIIFIDKNKTTQQWELLGREPNKPVRTVSHKWAVGQAPELLYQKLSGAFFSIEEDEAGSLTIIDVVQRIKENFGANAEKVTKAFYTDFKKQHTEFLDFINGIEDTIPDKENTNKQWYASLMLNRLMFCYFIQKKGFLDQDKNYLQNKLAACRKLKGEGKFYSFYRSFLLELFHDGLGKPINKRSEELPVELGKIPYLNGGLFDVHELEMQFDKIKIDDDAFERIFNFFDKWEWHLDTREHTEGRTINPDVIGYIFEKYINDRASMGAYYTKEDITDYIGKNTIIPFLFDETERNYKQGFRADSDLWNSFKQSGDTYFYDAVKKGIPKEGGLFHDLPEEIHAGFVPKLEKEIVTENTSPHLWEMRKGWNTKAPEEIALPTEIYRELIERRKRYADIKGKIEKGELTHINDFITYNLNIRQFAQDFIETTEDPAFIRHFYKALNSITILDPTCGSGAFLFAALNILEPLYETCIKRMEEFTEEQPGKHKFFEETLAEIHSEQHPNLQYFVFKSIILNNLFGVDIMNEAVEIAKLRLFLKLVATVDVDSAKNNFGLEPLPDIDFNIRAGNTLIGFATEKELLETIEKKEGLFAQDILDEFKGEFAELSQLFQRFQNAQLITDQGSDSFKSAKAKLNKRLKELNHKLNVYLATNYGIDAELKTADFGNWLTTHQPFHWFAEFYQIVAGNGGFDVILGNPPYVEYSKIRKTYTVKGIGTEECGNLYAMISERSNLLMNLRAKLGLIIPLSFSSSKRMRPIQKLIESSGVNWIANLEGGTHPSVVFEGVTQNLCIMILSKYKNKRIYTTRFIRCYGEERHILFSKVQYIACSSKYIDFGVPKVSFVIEKNILRKLFVHPQISRLLRVDGSPVYVHRIAGSGYAKSFDFVPFFKNSRDGEKKSDDYKLYKLKGNACTYVGLYNSTTFYSYWEIFYDAFKVGKYSVESFPFPSDISQSKITDLHHSTEVLMEDMKRKAKRIQVSYQSTGIVEYDRFFPRESKFEIDKIDEQLGALY